MKTWHIPLFLALTVMCSGCGTVMGRTSLHDLAYGEKIPRCYPATYIDGALIGESFTSENPNTSGVQRFFVCVGSVIDLPISLMIDTLVLPYDVCKSTGKQPPPSKSPDAMPSGAGSSAARTTP